MTVKPEKISYDYSDLNDDLTRSCVVNALGIWPLLVLKSLEIGKNINMEFIRNTINLSQIANMENEKFFKNEIWDESIKKICEKYSINI